MNIENEIVQKQFKSEYHKLIVNMIYTSNALMAKQAQVLKDNDITTQQYNLLRILRGQYPNSATINLLKERMLDKMSDASRLVEKLRLKGLAKRVQSRKDRREANVSITEKGLELLNNLDPLMNKFEDELSQNLNLEEAKQLNFLLDKLRG